MQKMKIVLQAAALVMAIMVASYFLAAIPVAKATPITDPETSKTDISKVDIIYYTIIATNGKETHKYQIAIDRGSIAKARQMIMAEQMDAQDATMEIASHIHLTAEQKVIILNSTSVKIMAGDSSYVEITGWLMLWCLPYGAFYHVHLCAIDAINYDTAINAAIVIFAFLTVVLLATVIGAVLCAVVALTLGMIKVDYNAMYGADHNADNSFDMWSEATFYQTYCTFMVIDTPRYQWLATMVGAYIMVDKTTGKSSWGNGSNMHHGGGGCRAYAI